MNYLRQRERTRPQRSRVVPFSFAAFAALFAFLSCKEANTAARAQLAQSCLLNSDCSEPLVCAYRKCHLQCKTARDCPGGGRCVIDDKPSHVCQLPEEKACSVSSSCAGSQVCSRDGQCRDTCRADSDCLGGQVCVQGSCAQPDEVGTLTLYGAGLGDRCTYATECAGTLVCLNGVCDVECITDKDCRTTWTCRDTRCTPPAGKNLACPIETDAGALGAVASVVAGDASTCALRGDQALFCWGANDLGQIGIGAADGAPHAIPLPVAPLSTGVRSVAMGAVHACAVKADGSLLCWGSNTFGQLGLGATDGGVDDMPRPTPTLVPGVSGAVQVAAGESHTCAVRGDGTLWCWGQNASGQLALPADPDPHPAPSQVTALGSNVAEVAIAGATTCARMNDGSAQCWGDNSYGQLGDGSLGVARETPGPVPALGATVASLGGGVFAHHVCAVRKDATLYCWGADESGELGQGSATATRPEPVAVAALGKRAASVRCGGTFTCATTTDGTAWCWGSNAAGHLGDGTTTSSFAPIQVSLLGDRVASVTAGTAHACAMRSDGGLYCWGANDLGQLGEGSLTQQNAPTPAAVPCP